MSWFDILKDIKDIPIKFKLGGDGMRGYYNDALKEIVLYTDKLMDEVKEEIDFDAVVEVLSHESIHAVQYDVEDSLAEIEDEFEELIDKLDQDLTDMVMKILSKFLEPNKKGSYSLTKPKLSEKVSFMQGHGLDQEIVNLIYDELEEFLDTYSEYLSEVKPNIIKNCVKVVEQSLLMEISAYAAAKDPDQSHNVRASTNGVARDLYDALNNIEITMFSKLLKLFRNISSLLTSGWAGALQDEDTLMGKIGIYWMLEESTKDKTYMELYVIQDLDYKIQSMLSTYEYRDNQRLQKGIETATRSAELWALNEEAIYNMAMGFITNSIRGTNTSLEEAIQELAQYLSEIMPNSQGFMDELVDMQPSDGLSDVDWEEVARNFTEEIKEEMEVYR